MPKRRRRVAAEEEWTPPEIDPGSLIWRMGASVLTDPKSLAIMARIDIREGLPAGTTLAGLRRELKLDEEA